MTGPEHYREAERLTEAVTKPGALLPQNRVLERGDHGDVLALAQVHATLAHAAAVIAGTALIPADRHLWQKAIDPEYDAEVTAARIAAAAAAHANPGGFGWAQVTA